MGGVVPPHGERVSIVRREREERVEKAVEHGRKPLPLEASHESFPNHQLGQSVHLHAFPPPPRDQRVAPQVRDVLQILSETALNLGKGAKHSDTLVLKIGEGY